MESVCRVEPSLDAADVDHLHIFHAVAQLRDVEVCLVNDVMDETGGRQVMSSCQGAYQDLGVTPAVP